jgi:hypothetical protein
MSNTFIVKLIPIAFACSVTFKAYALSDMKQINVPCGDLVPALEAFEAQTAAELVYQPDQLRHFHTNGIRGTYGPKDALQILLNGLPVELRTDASGAMIVGLPRTPAGQKDTPLSQRDTDTVTHSTQLEEVVVTGTPQKTTTSPSPEFLKRAKEVGFNPEVRNSVTVYCWKDADLGSRIPTKKCVGENHLEIILERRQMQRDRLRESNIQWK